MTISQNGEKEQNMVSRLPVIDDDGEVGDLSEVDPALFRPFQELPAPLQAKLRGRPNLRDEGHNHLIELAVAAGAPEQTSSSAAMCVICAADSGSLPN